MCVCCARCVNIQAEILKSPRKPSGVLARAILVVRGEDGWNGGRVKLGKREEAMKIGRQEVGRLRKSRMEEEWGTITRGRKEREKRGERM